MKRVTLLLALCVACGDDDKPAKPDVPLSSVRFDVGSSFYVDESTAGPAALPEYVRVYLLDRRDGCDFYKSTLGQEEGIFDLAYVMVEVDHPAPGLCALGGSADDVCSINVIVGKVGAGPGKGYRLNAVAGSLEITSLEGGKLRGKLRVRFPVNGKDTLDCEGSGGGGAGGDPETCTCLDVKGTQSTCEWRGELLGPGDDTSCCNVGAETEELVLEVGVEWCASPSGGSN